MAKRPKPTQMNKAYRIFDEEDGEAQVVSHCIGCGWESHPLSCTIESGSEDENLTVFDKIRSVTNFNRGYLTGAFSNHICGIDPGTGVAQFKYPAG